jgi:hypothetical protein
MRTRKTAVYLSMAEKIHPTPRFSTSPDVFHFDHWGKAGLDLLPQQFADR